MSTMTHEPTFDDDAPVPADEQPISAETYQRILQPTIGLLLYNPGDEERAFDLASETFRVPPHSRLASKKAWGVEEHQPYPAAARDAHGVLPCIGFMAHKTHGKHRFINKPISAQEFALFAVGNDGTSGLVGRHGIRVLSGDPILDARIKKDARKAWVEAIYQIDCGLAKGHEQLNAKMRESGMPLIPPSPRVRVAMERKLAYESTERDLAKFACPRCGERHNTETDRNTHILRFHAEFAAQLGVGVSKVRDLDGNEREINVGARLAGQATGAMLEGESPEAARARLRPEGHVTVPQATMDMLMKNFAELQAKVEALEGTGAPLTGPPKTADELLHEGFEKAEAADLDAPPPRTRPIKTAKK